MKTSKFPYLLATSALLIASTAAFFSVIGLSMLFAGSFYAVVFMASSLEIAKIISASFAYRFWKRINILMRIYLVSGVIVLVIITSLGIFGFLSRSYMGATIDFEKLSNQLIFQEEEVERLKDDKTFLEREMEAQIATLPDNYITAARITRDQYMLQIREINNRISELSLGISDLKVKLVDVGIDVGPAIYIARAFNISIDDVVKVFILMLVFVFDPLAVTLVIAANIAFMDRSKQKQEASKYKNEWEQKVEEESIREALVPKYREIKDSSSEKKPVVVKEATDNFYGEKESKKQQHIAKAGDVRKI